MDLILTLIPFLLFIPILYSQFKKDGISGAFRMFCTISGLFCWVFSTGFFLEKLNLDWGLITFVFAIIIFIINGALNLLLWSAIVFLIEKIARILFKYFI